MKECDAWVKFCEIVSRSPDVADLLPAQQKPNESGESRADQIFTGGLFERIVFV